MPYTQDNIASPGQPPLLWSDIDAAFRIINQNFVELYATIGGGSVVDFSNLSTDVTPSVTEIYDLGAPTRRWKDLYLGGSSLYLGDAVITATGSAVNLPVGSTIAGSVLDNEYFKTIAVAGQSNIVADAGGEDTLTLVAGNAGITLTTNAATDTLTITNSGVTQLLGTVGQIGVSGSTGNITLTNLGVTSLTAGQGVSLSSTIGAVTVTNSGLIGIDPGIGITVSPRDPITGLVTVTNSQPNIPQAVFNTIAVPTQSDVIADSTTDTLTLQTSGNGLSITTNASTDTITFANTGVHSLAVGNGLTASAGTGSINLTLDATLSRNIIGQLNGSVFADDSTLLVDGVDGKIVGPVDTLSLKTRSTQIALGFEAGFFNQDNNAVAIGDRAGKSLQGISSVAIGLQAGEINQGAVAVAVGAYAGQDFQADATTAVGGGAGTIGQQRRATALGRLAGANYQGEGAVAVGYGSARVLQGDRAIAIGEEAAETSQAWRAIAIGWRAGNTAQGFEAISVGRGAGLSQQNDYAVAIGAQAGQYRQGEGAVSLGVDSGVNDQAGYAISIGYVAGETNQGAYSIAIGAAAGRINQAPQSIVLNASGTNLNADDPGFFVNPIRSTFNDGSTVIAGRPIVYNTTTKELFYTSTLEFINSTISTTDSSGLTVDVQTTFNTDVTFENDITVAERLTVKGGRVINLAELQSVVAASADFADFQARVAALS